MHILLIMSSIGVIIANFGGPRNLEEVTPFLCELLTDEEVLRTPLPRFIEKGLFKKIAVKRASKICKDYRLMGGKSPIFDDTEAIAEEIRKNVDCPVITFHRYLPATHASFIEALQRVEVDRFVAIALYPQFSYSTTGSIARFFSENLTPAVLKKIHWIKSYPTDDLYIQAMQNCIQDYLLSHRLEQKETFFFFSAHGLPQRFVEDGDPYEMECHESYDAIRKMFPGALSLLAFQSKFGPGKWLRPYTGKLCENPDDWNQGRRHIVFIPLSFTSDHLETLFEIEHIYLPLIRQKGLCAYRCPALNRRSDWTSALTALLSTTKVVSNDFLIRKKPFHHFW